MKVTTVWCAALLAAAVPGCKKKDKGEADNSAAKTATGDKMAGSDTMAGSGSAAMTPDKPVEAAKPATPEDQAKRYTECVGLWKAKDWTKFQDCYAKDATSEFVDSSMPPVSGNTAIIDEHKAIEASFPDRSTDVELILINGKQAATVALLQGTQTGPLKTPMGDVPPTNKKFGQQTAHIVHFSDDGKTADKEQFYQDFGEMMGQLGISKSPARAAETKPWHDLETVIAKDDDTEKKNLESAKALMDNFNKHDLKAMASQFDDKITWSEQGMAKDWTSKADAEKAHVGLTKAFPDVKFSSETMWAAGDYVAWQGTMTGTNTGPAPEMGLAKPTKKPISVHFFQLLKYGKDGKLTQSYGFWNSAAMAMQLGMVPPPAPAKK